MYSIRIFITCLLLSAASLCTHCQLPPHSTPLEERYGKPYVNVTINHRGPFRFVVDTGTGAGAFISPELVRELKLPIAGQGSINDPGGQASRKVPVVLIRSLELAGIQFENVPALEQPILTESQSGACLGLLGFRLFRDHLLTLDFPNHRLVLSSGALTPDGGRSVLPFRTSGGVPVTTLVIPGVGPMDTLIDSGGAGLVFPESLVLRLPYEKKPALFANGRSLATTFRIRQATLAADVLLGEYVFPHPTVLIHPAVSIALLGSPPMQNFAVTFDQQNQLVSFVAAQQRIRVTGPPCPMRIPNQPHPAPILTEAIPVGE